MTKAQTTRVFNATVHLDGMGGQGVLVPEGFILTATHCIKWNGEGGMALGDHCIEAITTKSGVSFRVGVLAADPVSDMAVLGEADNQVFFDDCNKFEQWREVTPAVPLAITTPVFRKPFAAHILTHKDNWVGAQIVKYSMGPPLSGCLTIHADDQIEGGTSGGPIVDSSGRLIGVVSQFSQGQGAAGEKCDGTLPIAQLALPQWVWLLIRPTKRQRMRER